MKSAFISIIGRPSAGKSTFLNTICGEKVSIVSPVPQTTRNKIRGIITRDEGQLIFIDTPGYHNSEKKFNVYLKDLAGSALEESDIILYMIDTTRPPGKEEGEILELLKPHYSKTLILMNKTDLHESNPAAAAEFIKEGAAEIMDSGSVFPVSAVTGKGLDTILKRLFEIAPEGDPMYPEDYYTDQQPEFRVMEIVREKAINLSRQELPHSIYVEIADMEMKYKESGEIKKLWVRAFLVAERDSQKGILVGRGGENIKKIRSEAQKELNGIFPYNVHLDLRVKVNPKWRRNDGILKKMLY
ncbi:MAG: GTPase Era [Spirochaetales bacterium]|uniref:GTPase Era n=1 Tax=Candidatus Thalassospirochaeta sargassi TaxID=3119039 RepID=A0AAJ1MNL9_9SPIO|nr:GTPase Era [Spirochaetales bacterium]